jgi:hypothetical protein
VRFVRGAWAAGPVAPTRVSSSAGSTAMSKPHVLAVEATVVGQTLLLGRPVLLVYAAILAIAFWAFVRSYEEPTLARRYGREYEAYRRAVPGWVPRLRPWDPDGA